MGAGKTSAKPGVFVRAVIFDPRGGFFFPPEKKELKLPCRTPFRLCPRALPGVRGHVSHVEGENERGDRQTLKGSPLESARPLRTSLSAPPNVYHSGG